MPVKAPTACNRSGCKGLVRDGVCSACGPRRRHSEREYDRQRGSASARGYDRRWQKLRKMFLAANPLCVECQAEGRTVAATDVDHIVPKRAGGTDAWENLQGLCHECHSRKTQGEKA